MLLKPRYILLFVLLIVFFDTSQPAFGQTVTPDSALQVILDSIKGTDLSLAQAEDFASKNATSVRQAEAGYLAAQGILRRERGAFDPDLYFTLNHQNIKQPTASFFAGADVLVTEQTTTETGLRWNLPTGTQLDLSLNTTNLKTNSSFAFLNPEYDAVGSLSLRQPLLGGFTSSARKQLITAELAYDAAKARYDQEVLALNAEVESSYWALYSAERDFAVQQLTVDRGKAFLHETELRQKAGLAGPNDVANAKSFLAQQELLLIDRREDLDAKSDQMAVLLGMRPDNGMTRFITNDNPPVNFPVTPVDNLLDEAMNNNLELQAAKKDVEASNALVDAAGWEALPQVDLVGSLSSTGLGGDPHQVIFGSDTLRTTSGGSFGDVLSQTFKRKYPGWSIGVEVNLPIGLRSGLGEKDRLEAQSLSYEQKYIEMSRILEQQVRAAHRELSNGNDRLKAAADGVEAAREQVRIGTIEFKNGRITAFELVRLNEDFAVAQRSYSEALVRTVNAVAALKKLTSGKYTAISKY